MMNEPTVEKLRAMRLEGMVASWLEQQKDTKATALAFDERFGMLVDAEWIHRENKRLGRALKEAKLKLSQACVEDIDYPARRELDKAVIRQLSSCRWVQEHQAVLITGPTGTGKTYVACALAQQACRKGFRAVYRRASRLFDELRIAHADGTYVRTLSRLARVDVFIIDDFAIAPVSDENGGISSSFSRTDTARGPPSSPASSPRPTGTTTSPIRPLRTPSATASSITPTASC